MKKTPALTDIHAAELRLYHSLQDTRENISRVEDRSRSNLARIATKAIIAGIAGLSIIWLITRRTRKSHSATAVDVARTSSVMGIILAFLLRYGRHSVPFFLHQLRQSQRRAAVAKQASLLRIHNP